MNKKNEQKIGSPSKSNDKDIDTTFLHPYAKMAFPTFEITSAFHYNNHAKLKWNKSDWLQACYDKQNIKKKKKKPQQKVDTKSNVWPRDTLTKIG